jgi:phage repressor protein C with HTH and peptisase S24 domain
MEPGLYDGDTVVVDTAQTEPLDGEAFAVNYDGELVVKRMIRDAGQWWLSSDNPNQAKYPRKACTENTHIIGRIVQKQSMHI